MVHDDTSVAAVRFEATRAICEAMSGPTYPSATGSGIGPETTGRRDCVMPVCWIMPSTRLSGVLPVS
jgi:hypothetical protein